MTLENLIRLFNQSLSAPNSTSLNFPIFASGISYQPNRVNVIEGTTN